MSTPHPSSVPRLLGFPLPPIDAFNGIARVKLPAWRQACRKCLAVSSRCCCWDSTVGGRMHHPVTSDFAHSCPQLHPQSGRPRHAWWTSLSHSPSNSPSRDSLSPSIHSVSLLQLSGCTAARTRAGLHPLQSPPYLPLTLPPYLQRAGCWATAVSKQDDISTAFLPTGAQTSSSHCGTV